MGGYIRAPVKVLWWESTILWMMVLPVIFFAIVVALASALVWTFDLVRAFVVTKAKL